MDHAALGEHDPGERQNNGRIHFMHAGWRPLMVEMEGAQGNLESLALWTFGESGFAALDQARLQSRSEMKRFWFTSQETLDHTEAIRGEKDRIEKIIQPPVKRTQ